MTAAASAYLQRSEGLLIPVALAPSGRLVKSWEGEPKHRYRCPDTACNAEVLWRRASTTDDGVEIRRPHFAHIGESFCSGESVTHSAAKLRVCQDIQDWIDGFGTAPHFAIPCPKCHGPREPLPLPDVASVHIERAPIDGAPFIADVVLESKNGGRAAIEVVKTHRAEREKLEAYKSLAWWVEVNADDVIGEPSRWSVIASNGGLHGRTWLCSDCCEKREARIDSRQREAVKKIQEAESRMRQAQAMRSEAAALVQAQLTKIDGVDALIKARGDEIERLASERDKIVQQLAQTRSEYHDEQTKVEAAKQKLARVRSEMSSEETALAAAKLADISAISKTYKQIWDATEAQRRIAVALARRVYRYQRELIAKETTETNAIWMGKASGEQVDAAPVVEVSQ